jgi:hypothetical protein
MLGAAEYSVLSPNIKGEIDNAVFIGVNMRGVSNWFRCQKVEYFPILSDDQEPTTLLPVLCARVDERARRWCARYFLDLTRLLWRKSASFVSWLACWRLGGVDETCFLSSRFNGCWIELRGKLVERSFGWKFLWSLAGVWSVVCQSNNCPMMNPSSFSLSTITVVLPNGRFTYVDIKLMLSTGYAIKMPKLFDCPVQFNDLKCKSECGGNHGGFDHRTLHCYPW